MMRKPDNYLSAAGLLTEDHAELDGLLQCVFDSHRTGDAGKIFSSLDLFWARLAMHIRAEHLHLFPAVQRLGNSELDSLIADLHNDHDYFMRELAVSIKFLRTQTEAVSDKAGIEQLSGQLSDLRKRLDGHNEIEETRIYPLFAKGTSSDDLFSGVKKELDNLPPRFRSAK